MGHAAFGALLKAGDGASSEAFTAIAEVVNISGVTPSQGTTDVTHMSSSNGYREFKTTVRDAGSVTIDINWVADNSTQTAETQTKFDAGTFNNYQLAFTDDSSSTCTFSACVESFEINHTLDGKAEGSITYKVSSGLTWA